MSELLCNDLEVLEAHVILPRIGLPTATLSLDDEAAVAAQITLRTADGTAVLTGTLARGAVVDASGELRVVGGAGGLGASLRPQGYRQVTLRQPLLDVLREAGERLSATSDAATLGTLLPLWVRPQGRAEAALSTLLAAAPGAAWRVLADGTVWVGPETWPPVQIDHDVVHDEPLEGCVQIATDALEPALRPGTTFRDRRVSVVEHRVRSHGTTTTVWFEGPAKGDRLQAALAAFTKPIARRLDYLALYAARVTGQTGQTLDLTPEDPRLSPLAGVPLLLPLPGTTVEVLPGATVLLGFEAGDPRKPRAQLWQAGSLRSLRLEVASGAALELTSEGTVRLTYGGAGFIQLGGPEATVPLALGGDPVASAAVTPVPSRRVLGPPG